MGKVSTPRANELSSAFNNMSNAAFGAASTISEMDVSVFMKMEACRYASIAVLQAHGYPLPVEDDLLSCAKQLGRYIIPQLLDLPYIQQVMQFLSRKAGENIIEPEVLFYNVDDYRNMLLALQEYLHTVWGAQLRKDG